MGQSTVTWVGGLNAQQASGACAASLGLAGSFILYILLFGCSSGLGPGKTFFMCLAVGERSENALSPMCVHFLFHQRSNQMFKKPIQC